MHDLRHDAPIVSRFLTLLSEVPIRPKDPDNALPKQGCHEGVVDELAG